MDYDGYFTRLSGDECRQLLRARSVGRVSWRSVNGLEILPVTYTMSGDLIAFRTGSGTVMAELLTAQDVSFEIDDVDEDTATGWSVLVYGRAQGYLGDYPEGLTIPSPWAPGDHPILVVIEPQSYSGRAVSATTGGAGC